MPTVTEINQAHELGGYRLAWKSLLAQTRNASFFQSLDWLEAYWRHYGHAQRLRVLMVEEGDELLGILPLVVRTERTRVGPVRVLTYPLHDWGTFYGPIGAQATATLLGGLAHIRDTERDWDLLDLRWVNRDGSDVGRTQRAMHWTGWRPHEQVWSRTSMIDLRGTWSEYWSARGTKLRNNVARCERKLTAEGAVSFIRYRPQGTACGDGDPRWDLYDACEQIAERSWQGSSTTGTTLSHKSVREYLRDAHAAAAHAGGLDLNLLSVAGRPVAFAYNNHFQGFVFGLRVGYDPVATRAGAGTVLARCMIENSYQRGDHTLDLGPGSIECKRPWRTAIQASYRYTHFPLAVPRAQVLRLKRQVQLWLGREAGASPAKA